jgi:hypothetical protein
MRPCTCDRFQKDQPYQLGQCRLCWLYHNDDRYRRLWDGLPLEPQGNEPDGPPKMPSLLQQAANFGGAVVRHVANGMKQVSPEEKQRRLDLCVICEHYANGRCAKCGCGLDSKTGWDSERCPIGKW